MPSLKEMQEWNYAEASDYFYINKNSRSNEANAYMNFIAKRSEVRDIRGKSGVPEEAYHESWLIVIDGASCSGKTTTAKEIKNQFPDTTEIADIDEICLLWMKEKQKEYRNRIELLKFYQNYDNLSTIYLKDNLESIVERASNGGKKSVIVVGTFLEMIFRGYMGTTLGKHFKKVMYLTMHEPLEKIRKNNQKRDKEFHLKTTPELWMGICGQYAYIEKVLSVCPSGFGIGADVSLIINSETKLY